MPKKVDVKKDVVKKKVSVKKVSSDMKVAGMKIEKVQKVAAPKAVRVVSKIGGHKVSPHAIDQAMQGGKMNQRAEQQARSTMKNQENVKMMDKDRMMNQHKKTVEILSDANKMAVEIVKSLSTLQTQFMRQSFEDFSSMMKEISAAPMSPESWKNQAGHMKDSMSKVVDHSSNMSNMMIKTNNDLYNKFQNHFSDAFEDMKYSVVSKKKH